MNCTKTYPPESRENDSCSMILDIIDNAVFWKGSYCLFRKDPNTKEYCLALLELSSAVIRSRGFKG